MDRYSKKSEGRIVNVPNIMLVKSTLRLLPERYENLGVIMVKLKKGVAYK